MNIGFAMRSITPDGPVSMGGSDKEKVTDQVRDPITVTAMVLENGNEQAVLVSCDIVSMTKPMKQGVCEKVKQLLPELDTTKITLFATHTHNAPFIVNPYWTRLGHAFTHHKDVLSVESFIQLIIRQVSAAIEEAWNRRAPGSLSWGQGSNLMGRNRRVLYDDGTAKMFGEVNTPHFRKLGGPEDHRVELLFAWDADQRLLGMLVNVACTSQYISHNAISADLFGEVRLQAAQKWGADVHVLGMIGAAGDLHPRDVFNRNDRQRTQDEVLQRAVRSLVRTIEDVMDEVKEEKHAEPEFKHHVTAVQLPRHRVTKTEVESAAAQHAVYQQWLSEQGEPAAAFDRFIKLGFYVKFGHLNQKAILERAELQKTDPFFQVDIHAIRIGDIVIVTNPFELFAEYGLQIKARSRARQTFIAELADDRGAYLPTEEALQSGGYSTDVFAVQVGPEGGKLLVEHTVRAIQEIWPSE